MRRRAVFDAFKDLPTSMDPRHRPGCRNPTLSEADGKADDESTNRRWLFGRAGVHRLTHGRNDGIQIERFPDDLIDARRVGGEFFHPGGIRAGDHEDTPFQDRLAQMLKEAPVVLIGRSDVIHDHLGLVLTDKSSEIHAAVPNVVRVAADRDEAGDLEHRCQ
jgi:hypothetical protein